MINKSLLKQFKDKSKKELSMAFIQACHNGELGKVKYLLTSNELKENADIHYMGDVGFIAACDNGHIEIVKYLAISPELKEHANIHTINDFGFTVACDNGKINLVKYLLNSPELESNLNVHTNFDAPFKSACEKNQLDVIHYLICDKNIKKTKEIQKFLIEGKFENIEKIFESRKLNKRLKNELYSNNADKRKLKI